MSWRPHVLMCTQRDISYNVASHVMEWNNIQYILNLRRGRINTRNVRKLASNIFRFLFVSLKSNAKIVFKESFQVCGQICSLYWKTSRKKSTIYIKLHAIAYVNARVVHCAAYNNRASLYKDYRKTHFSYYLKDKKRTAHLAFNAGFCLRIARLNFSRLSALLSSVILQLCWKLF